MSFRVTLRRLAWSVVAGLMPVLAQAQGGLSCGGIEAPCEIDGGSFLVERPAPGPVPPKGAMLFLHGWGGSGAGILRNRGLVEDVLGRGYIMVAPNGTPRAQGSGRSWSFHPDFPARRDDQAFLRAVMAELERREGIPRARMLLGGFSAGGFMASYLACADPGAAAAFVPVSGGFWRPHPESCAGPVRLFHTHGWRDTVVPLEGRWLGGGRAAQGDIFHGMDLWRQASGCDALMPDGIAVDDAFWRRSWHGCAPGAALEFALFPGGHAVPPGWADMVLDWFEALPPLSPGLAEID